MCLAPTRASSSSSSSAYSAKAAPAPAPAPKKTPKLGDVVEMLETYKDGSLTAWKGDTGEIIEVGHPGRFQTFGVQFGSRLGPVIHMFARRFKVIGTAVIKQAPPPVTPAPSPVAPVHTFKVGDKVRVVRKLTKRTDDFWNSWVPSMDAAVNDGKTYTVNRVTTSGVWFEESSKGFPPASLKLVHAADRPYQVGDWVEVLVDDCPENAPKGLVAQVKRVAEDGVGLEGIKLPGFLFYFYNREVKKVPAPAPAPALAPKAQPKFEVWSPEGNTPGATLLRLAQEVTARGGVVLQVVHSNGQRAMTGNILTITGDGELSLAWAVGEDYGLKLKDSHIKLAD